MVDKLWTAKQMRFRRFGTLALIFVALAVIWWLVMFNETGPTWHNITVGKSTTDQVISTLGQPTNATSSLFSRAYYYHEGPIDYAAHKIVIVGNVVDSIEEDMSIYFPRIVYLKEFVSQYGPPDYVMWSQESLLRRVAVYPKKGLLVVATTAPVQESKVTSAIYFRPCPLICLQIRFLNVFSPFNPFPNSDIVGPQNPWEFTQGMLR